MFYSPSSFFRSVRRDGPCDCRAYPRTKLLIASFSTAGTVGFMLDRGFLQAGPFSTPQLGHPHSQSCVSAGDSVIYLDVPCWEHVMKKKKGEKKGNNMKYETRNTVHIVNFIFFSVMFSCVYSFVSHQLEFIVLISKAKTLEIDIQ